MTKTKKQPLPKSVNIHGLTYAIERTEFRARDSATYGLIDHIEQKIHVSPSLTDEKQRMALLHEIIHGVLDLLKLDEESNTEQLVQGLTVGLFNTLKGTRIII